jgi:hypothetical protein
MTVTCNVSFISVTLSNKMKSRSERFVPNATKKIILHFHRENRVKRESNI